MKHNTINELGEAGELHSVGKVAMSWLERLERWAHVLGREPQHVLRTLEGTEYQTGEVQSSMRRDQSAISVAFADFVLRAEGLDGDTYGAAKRFFGLSDEELHNTVCSCHFGSSMYAGTVGSRLYSLTSSARAMAGFSRPGDPAERVSGPWLNDSSRR